MGRAGGGPFRVVLEVQERLVVGMKWGSGLPATAASQPPAYQAQSTPAALSRSPIVGASCGGTSHSGAAPGAWGWPRVEPDDDEALGASTEPSATRLPAASNSATASSGRFGNIGVAAAINQWWLMNEPPNAAWKK